MAEMKRVNELVAHSVTDGLALPSGLSALNSSRTRDEPGPLGASFFYSHDFRKLTFLYGTVDYHPVAEHTLSKTLGGSSPLSPLISSSERAVICFVDESRVS